MRPTRRKVGEMDIKAATQKKLEEIRKKVLEKLQPPQQKPNGKEIARQYLGDLSAQVQEVAATLLHRLHGDQSFQNTPKDNDNNVILYPANCKFITENYGGTGVVVIEEPPQLRTVLTSGNGRTTHRIPVPYSIFVVHYRKFPDGYEKWGFGLSFSDKPVSSLDENLWCPTFPHIGQVEACQPATYKKRTVADLVTDSINVFWQSSFIYFFSPFMVGNTVINGWDDWQKLGENNPLDILKGSFMEGMSLRQIINRWVGNTGPSINEQQRTQNVVRNVVAAIQELLKEEELSQRIDNFALQPK